jgi:hypothetical protein
MVYDEIRERILMHFSRLTMDILDYQPVMYEHWVTVSKDGHIWEKPVLLDEQLKYLSPPAYPSLPGPGTLTMLRANKYRGRIMIPVYFPHCYDQMMGYDCASSIYTDDGGYDGVYKSSKVEQALSPYGMAGMSESVIVETPNGEVILNMRAGGWSGDSARGIAVSLNGGEIFGPVLFDTSLFDPASIDGCQASLLRIINDGGEFLYFANPHNKNWRENMTVQRVNASISPSHYAGFAKYDWEVVASGLDHNIKVHDYQGGAYGCLVELFPNENRNARIGYLYERSKQHCSGHACSIHFATFNH